MSHQLSTSRSFRAGNCPWLRKGLWYFAQVRAILFNQSTFYVISLTCKLLLSLKGIRSKYVLFQNVFHRSLAHSFFLGTRRQLESIARTRFIGKERVRGPECRIIFAISTEWKAALSEASKYKPVLAISRKKKSTFSQLTFR